MEVEVKLNRLLKETEMKLDKCKQDRRVVLIDFVKDYNNIWNTLIAQKTEESDERV